MARKILLADDSVTAQNMGRKILTDAGYEVVTVNNGSAALKKILEQKPDLIVLDVYMPGYSGLEVCQRIKENKETSRIPVLLTVGKLEPFKPEEARRARADAFVVKPFEASELLAALTKLEGKIVPQAEPYKPGRFAKAAAAVEADDRAEDDASWKARLRIPTGKKRDPEPDVDYAATQGKGFRDLRAEETGKKSRAKGKETEDTFERPIPAGLPSDITPEEIAAITAAAARLNGAAPAAETTAPEPVLAAPVEIEATPAAAEEPAPVTFASAPEIQSSEVQNEIQSAVLDVQIAPAEPATGAQAEKIESVVEQAVAVPQQVPAPAEAVAAAPVEVAAAQPAQLESLPTLEAQQAEPQVVAPSTEMPVVAESTAPEAVPSAPPAEVVAAPVAATPETPAPAVVAPSADDEVMAALQSLMPAAENMSPLSSGTNGSGKSHEASFSLLNMTAQVDAATVKAHIAGPRWIAEEVALGAGEATLSLEREMEQAYAAVAAGEPPRASAEASAAVTQPESVAAVAEPLPEVPPARTPQPEGAEEPAVYAMASAAGAGDVAPVAAGVQLVLQEAAIIESVQPRPEAEVVTSVASSAPVDAPQSITEIESPQAASAPPAALPDHQTPKARIPEIRILETEIAEGAEDMVANWKNIRDSIAGAAPKRAPSKEDVPVEPVKAETEPSAAAPHDTAPAGAADAKAIASIVDSVLAELRPRIVEEIAKKLSGETKKD